MKPSDCDIHALLQRALCNPQIRDVCRALTQLIDASENQHLNTIFQGIMDDIFYTRASKWGLKRENALHEDSFSVREFLGLPGPLFRLINNMTRLGMQCNGPATVAYCSEYHSGSVAMSPFEAYFVFFADFIMKPTFLSEGNSYSAAVKSNSGNTSIQGSDIVDAPYFILLDEYLSHYFPMSYLGKPPSVNLGVSLKVSPKPYHSIVKSNFLLRHKISKSTSSHGDSMGCDVLTQLFSKLWMEGFLTKSGSMTEKKVPTLYHVRAIRVLVKHIHFFCNAHREDVRHLQSDSLWENVNQGVMNSLEPRLYNFLLYCFDVWPRDQTFRIVLETWLSFVQPWRYTKGEMESNSGGKVDNRWYSFVTLYLKFYSTLFQVSIKRFKCMDLSICGNSLLLFRVAKVFKQPNLITLIDQAQANCLHEMSTNYGASYLVSSPSQNATYDAESMFSLEFTEVVKHLMETLCRALEALKSVCEVDAESALSTRTLQFFGYGALLDSSSGPQQDSDRKKTIQNLEYALHFFSDVYELPVPKIAETQSVAKFGEYEIADHVTDESGKISLSPSGRYQLQNNLRKFPIAVATDPELRPICSFESAFLVRFLYAMSSKFNKKFGNEIDLFCKRKDFIGKLCRFLFIPFDELSKPSLGRSLKPRLSLRFLAHLRNVFYIFLLYMISWLFGFSFMNSVLYIICFIVILVLIKVAMI